MAKRRHDEMNSIEVEGVSPRTQDSSERKKKKKKKDKNLMKGDASKIAPVSAEKERTTKESEKKRSKKEKEDRRKKRRKSIETHEENEAEEAMDLTLDETPVNEKKKKKRDKERSSEKKRKDKKSGSKKKQRHTTLSDSDNENVTKNGELNGSVITSTPGDENNTNANLPTVDEILKKATTKRNAFLHGHAAVPLFRPQALRSLDSKTQVSMVGASADFCERIMYLIHDTVSTAKKWMNPNADDDAVDLEESVVSDMVRLKKVPLAKQYVEMTLWRRVAELNRDHLLAASQLGFGKGFSKGDLQPPTSQGLLLHREDDPDAKFVSYRQAYMKNVVEQYSESLEKMREEESMDAYRVQFLLRCLDAGASLFGNLKCMEK